MATLHIIKSTWLKQAAVQSSGLSDGNKYAASAGQTFELASFESIEDLSKNDGDSHVKIFLAEPVKEKRTWYVFQRDVAIMDGDRVLFPSPEDDERTANRKLAIAHDYSGIVLWLPGGRKVHSDEPIIKSGNFSWGEASHGGERIPKDKQTVERIVKLAIALQDARAAIGRPFRITSWYRPEPFNSRVGGASRSQHLNGGAVDIVVEGYSGAQLARKIKPFWPGGVGIYPGNRKHILHLDVGAKRSWGV